MSPPVVQVQTALTDAGPPEARSYVDWAAGRIIVETTLRTPGPLDPRKRFRVVQQLDREARRLGFTLL